KSDASLQLTSILGGPWKLTGVFRIFPRVIRNAVYDFVARNRYRWFGKKESCMVPAPELRSLFLS
ncbi:MAG TPA: DCC1-like thiol-disulfide oxidoreductase family protein, partial [Chitinophagaceae bacterium]